MDSDDDSCEGEGSYRVSTLSQSFTLCFDAMMTKAEIIGICEDLEENAGGRWEPLPGKRIGLRRVFPDNNNSRKEIRVVSRSHVKLQRKKEAFVFWPAVEWNAREIWKDDFTLAVKPGKYRTQLVAMGDGVSKWSSREAGMVRDAFLKRGVKVSSLRQIRQYSYKEPVFNHYGFV